ncbi:MULTISPECIES: cutinase family protein [Mycolicibacterium]|uniref:Cutinase n=2 Tax=Mycolicibacterium gilvum TaxID=1804 RepID=A0A378SIT4_9MYCO|nr:MULTISPECIES: cutinase family protein [Mycolicibacterium]ABP47433.1 cutinase [Mycolicibacterium gilvum PYR-GCK]MBV5242491.1 cutinase family protein [Mycolicibacterium sp. PAM1]MCV7058595.1 cutinase family protein [Mycolicibacterium gilvum]STZ42038.1 cutinase [Mycolicibacterium gilvum]
MIRQLRNLRVPYLVVALLFGAASLILPPAASAQACPQAELIFARGRIESPGAGVIGNALASALRNKTGRDIDLYAVKYPADTEVDIGANDMSQRIQYMARNCPDTRLVLGGYSLGAAVTDIVIAVPIAAFGFKNPLPDGVDRHIAAVALFGNGSQWVGPIANFTNPALRDRIVELCHGDDPICNPTAPENWQDNWPAHLASAYVGAGMVNQAADFIVGRL